MKEKKPANSTTDCVPTSPKQTHDSLPPVGPRGGGGLLAIAAGGGHLRGVGSQWDMWPTIPHRTSTRCFAQKAHRMTTLELRLTHMNRTDTVSSACNRRDLYTPVGRDLDLQVPHLTPSTFQRWLQMDFFFVLMHAPPRHSGMVRFAHPNDHRITSNPLIRHQTREAGRRFLVHQNCEHHNSSIFGGWTNRTQPQLFCVILTK